MKRWFCLCMAFALILAGLWSFFGSWIYQPPGREYPIAGIVDSIDRENDTVLVVDGAGNVWEFTGCEDYYLGDVVAFIMNDNGTPEIFDDYIVKARYVGNFS